jgi:HD-GYP domain-containing protein (c-di-GMP phosphodiesterase class II)
LLASFIQLIASAIDAKSSYTGGHCQRVPVLTKLLAQAACRETSGPYASFDLNEEEWEELHVASWLHDCGKVTTPDISSIRRPNSKRCMTAFMKYACVLK